MDTLINLPHFPKEDSKMRADSSKQAGGGPVATGLCAASKLGALTEYIGVLSDDSSGRFLIDDFKKHGVNTDNVNIVSGGRSFTSVIWLSKQSSTRTCVYDKGDLPPLELTSMQKQAIIDADLLMIDGNELKAALDGAKTAHEHGTKVLYDAGGLFDNVESLMPYVDFLIPSEEFALKFTKCDNAENAAKALFDKYSPEVVVITRGKSGGVIYDGKSITYYPAFSVSVVDSNGAGDVFHGAFSAGVLMGFDYKKCCCLTVMSPCLTAPDANTSMQVSVVPAITGVFSASLHKSAAFFVIPPIISLGETTFGKTDLSILPRAQSSSDHSIFRQSKSILPSASI